MPTLTTDGQRILDFLIRHRDRLPARLPAAVRIPRRYDNGLLAAAAIDELNNMVEGLTRRMMPWLDQSSHDDVAQRCRQSLLTRSIPRYDPADGRRARLTSFAFQCIRNFLRSEIRSRFASQGEELIGEDADAAANMLGKAPDSRLDHRIEAVAAQIRKNGAGLLTRRQIALVRLAARRPNASITQLAGALRWSTAEAARVMAEARARIAEIDLETFELPDAARCDTTGRWRSTAAG